MARGETCPNCGEMKWHQSDRGGHECSGCGTRGWLAGGPPTGGGGRGQRCHQCGKLTLVAADEGGNLRFCTHCGLVALIPSN